MADAPSAAHGFTIAPLTEATWPAFADLVARHDGVWGGCWCMAFHADGQVRDTLRRDRKFARVQAGTARAALVFEGAVCVGWCQFGPPDELPRIKHRRAHQIAVAGRPAAADWRITCFFVDKTRRGRGVASAALAGALELIAGLGGGTVESQPEDVADRQVSASFLYNSRLTMFERQGFSRVARLGQHHWLVMRTVPARQSVAVTPPST